MGWYDCMHYAQLGWILQTLIYPELLDRRRRISEPIRLNQYEIEALVLLDEEFNRPEQLTSTCKRKLLG
jgi:hypothetical protein